MLPTRLIWMKDFMLASVREALAMTADICLSTGVECYLSVCLLIQYPVENQASAGMQVHTVG